MSDAARPEAAVSSPATDQVIDVSIALINWNALEMTSDALASLQTHVQGVSYEVFVVDNGTTKDASVAELPRRFPWVRFIANDQNRGFTQANNQAMRLARGRYVLLLNNDTIQTENAIGDAVRYMDEHPDLGAVGILHRNNDAEKSPQPSAFGFARPVMDILGLFGLARPLPPTPLVEGDVDWVCGSFLLMRRQALDAVGLLDERYFIYDEDMDWCLNARRKGWKTRFWPARSMIHLGGAANPLMRDKTLVMFRSHVSYLRKNHGFVSATAFYLAMGLKLFLALGKQTGLWLIGRATRGEVWQRMERFWNFIVLRPSKVGAAAPQPKERIQEPERSS